MSGLFHMVESWRRAPRIARAPQNCEPDRGPLRAVRNTIAFPQAGQAGAASAFSDRSVGSRLIHDDGTQLQM